MRKFLLCVLCLTLSLTWVCRGQYRTGYAELSESETASALRSHIEYLASAALEGRAAGSEGEAEAAAYVYEAMQSIGLDMMYGRDGDIFGMKKADGDTLVSRNVAGVIQGYDKSLSDRYIVIGARLDNIGTRQVSVDGEPLTRIYNGANGNASGVAMMLELARMLKTNSLLLKRSVIFIAFGSSLEGQVGSWYFLNRSFQEPGKIDAMVDLDILGRGSSGFYAYTSSNADLNTLLGRLGNTLQPVKPALTAQEPFCSDHRMFYASEIPSVLFTTGLYQEYGTDRDTPSIIQYDYMERELEYLYNFTVACVNGEAPAFRPGEVKGQQRQDDIIPYYDCDFKPTFLGSSDPKVFLQKWVYAYLKYPQEAVRKGIQGRVLVDFVIDERGKVTDVRAIRGVDPLLDEEAVKVVAASPDWKPARLQGKKVKSRMSLYVEFKLEKKKK